MKYNILYEMKIESIENCQELYEAIGIAFVMEITLTHHTHRANRISLVHMQTHSIQVL